MASSLTLTEIDAGDLPGSAPAGKQIIFLDLADNIPKARNSSGVDSSLIAGDLNINNFFLIQSVSDWAAHSTDAGGGVRKLILDATYQIVGNITRTFPLCVNGTNTVFGFNPNVDIDFYSGTATSYIDDAAGGGLTIKSVFSLGTASSGSTFISLSNGSGIINIEECVIAYDNLGAVDSPISIASITAFGIASTPIINGLSFTSSSAITIGFTECSVRVDATTVSVMFDLSSATVVSSAGFQITFSGGANASGIKSVAASGNLIGDARGRITNCSFSSLGTPLVDITVDDFKWSLTGNRGILNTMPDAHSAMIINATETVIAAIDVMVKVAGTFTEVESSQFTADSSGRLTYDGIEPLRLPIDAGLSLEPASGANQNLFIKIFFGLFGMSATAREHTRSETRVDNADPRYLSTFDQITFNTGDYIEIFAGNASSTSNIIATNVKFRVN